MRKKLAAIALTVSEVINRTFTAGDQSVNVAITGNRVEVTGGTPEAVAIVNAVLGVSQPAAQPGPAVAPAKSTTKRKAAKGRGANQSGTKRGPYMTKKRREALAAEQTNGAADTDETETPAASVTPTGINGEPLPATLTPVDLSDIEAEANS